MNNKIKFYAICDRCSMVYQGTVPYNIDWVKGIVRCHCGALIKITSKEALEQ